MLMRVLGAVALLGAIVAPASAAGTAVATANVNLRAGPSVGYPAVNVVPYGDDVRVFGCLSSRSWCDVSYGGQRGWMSSNYLARVERGRRYVGAPVVDVIEVPVVSFSVGDYWDRHYRKRSFYRDRARWEDRRDLYDGPRHRDGGRRHFREERRDNDDWRDREERRDRSAYRPDPRDDRSYDENRDERSGYRDGRGGFRDGRLLPQPDDY